MSAKPEHLPATDTLGETVDFFGKGAGPRRAPNGDGSAAFMDGRHRYTFGSGARPLDGETIKRPTGRGGSGGG